MEPVHVPGVEEHVLGALRDLIVTGVLEPNQVLRLAPLAERFGVSIMPVRAALARLEAEGFVRQVPRRGTYVAPLELEDLEEIQAIRSGIEGLAARVGAEKITDSELHSMRSLLGAMRAEVQDRDLDSYLMDQWEIHDICYRASQRPRLSALIHEQRRRAERYVRLAVGSAAGFEQSYDYQERFLRACESRSGKDAQETIGEALRWVVEELAPFLERATSALTVTSRPSRS